MSATLPAASRAGSAPAGIDLDTCTDAAAMRLRLQGQLPGFAEGRLRIDALRVCKARRNTSLHRNPCPITLCYELRVSDRVQGRAGTQMLYAKVFRAGLAEALDRDQDRRLLIRPAFGEALTVLPELNMVLWALPNDPGLPQLATLLDPAQVGKVLPWASVGWARADVGAVHAELLRYEPECRATLRYSFASVDGSETRVLYAKTFCDPRGHDIDRRFEHFWQLAQIDTDAPQVAQPLGYCAVTRTAWQAPAPGAPLLQSLAAGDGAALMGRVARALARLHAAPLALLGTAPLAPVAQPGDSTPRSAAHWVAEARRRQKKISRACPALARRAAALADAISAHAGHQDTRPLSLIHGDFHPEQIWVDQGRIVLFDFDEFTLGDPMEDLAAFTLKLDQSGAPPGLGSALLEHYAACSPSRFERRSLNWHLALQSLVQASRAFVFQQPGWADELERRLVRGEACAATLTTGCTR